MVQLLKQVFFTLGLKWKNKMYYLTVLIALLFVSKDGTVYPMYESSNVGPFINQELCVEYANGFMDYVNQFSNIKIEKINCVTEKQLRGIKING